MNGYLGKKKPQLSALMLMVAQILGVTAAQREIKRRQNYLIKGCRGRLSQGKHHPAGFKLLRKMARRHSVRLPEVKTLRKLRRYAVRGYGYVTPAKATVASI